MNREQDVIHLPPLDDPRPVVRQKPNLDVKEKMKNYIRNKYKNHRSLKPLAMVNETDNENSICEENASRDQQHYSGFKLRKDTAKKFQKERKISLSNFKSGSKVKGLPDRFTRDSSSSDLRRIGNPQLRASESSDKGFRLRRSDTSSLGLLPNNVISSNPKYKTYPMRKGHTQSEKKFEDYGQSVMDEIEILQNNLEKTKRKMDIFRPDKSIITKVSSEDDDHQDFNTRDNSPLLSVSPTEEYWTNFNQITTSLRSRENISSQRRSSKIDLSRASNRKSTANEILFGNSLRNKSLAGSNGSSPAFILQPGSQSNRSDNLNLNKGFGGYMNREEKLAQLHRDLNRYMKTQKY
ncbi:unnamed protein product [Moneuplotes crassus]|uniref:Uncharacterized protein n=1 Tax=Euplotes crassus TaxID=5936 RepID=A0AAD1X0P2_EUPCR|nr:unnamed protein product [Moneuplotes crassus]